MVYPGRCRVVHIREGTTLPYHGRREAQTLPYTRGLPMGGRRREEVSLKNPFIWEVSGGFL